MQEMGRCLAMKKSPEELYNERVERITTAINLKTPDRVPIMLSFSTSFMARYGGVTVQELMYKPERNAEIREKLMEDFPECDTLGGGSMMITGPVSDALGQVLYKMPGKELSPHVPFQFVEKCNMRADEYALLIENPTEFLVTKYFPRIFKEEWEKGPTRAKIAIIKGILAQNDYTIFWSEKRKKWRQEFGLPEAGGGFSKAPFDVLSDTLRGMRESCLDLYKRPEKVIKACEALVPYCVKYGELPSLLRRRETSTRRELRPQVGMPLHRGCVPFMSLKQFETFYWPTLKDVMLQLIAKGFICRPFAEGDWGPNMKYWREVPKGKVVLKIDRADMFKAKELVGDRVCLQGNVPPSLLEVGTPRQVQKYCKKLIDGVGEGGGYIMDSSMSVNEGAKVENVRAMIRFTAKYGVYRR
jgi:hypothetical protein